MWSPDFMSVLKNQGVYIFGAGRTGAELCDVLEAWGIQVAAFIDNNTEKQGQVIQGKPCIHIETALDMGGHDCIIMVSPVKNHDILEQLRALKLKNVYDGNELMRMRFTIPFVKERDDYNAVVPFNHYESPYPDIREIHDKEEEIFNKNRKVPDIDFNVIRQLELADSMKELDMIDWGMQRKKEYRYYYDNTWFGRGSANVLYYMLRILKPKNIIEVGSGFSTAVMLDTNHMYFQGQIKIHSIEPNAARLKTLLNEEDHLTIHECNLQQISPDFFDQLGENDILFIDSSHVSKINSDVNYILFEILPRLSKGVYVHFHDIFYPFIYPKKWIYEGRAYNEMYLLRAFLMNNNKYSIQFFSDMMISQYPDRLSDKLKDNSGSLWLRKD